MAGSKIVELAIGNKLTVNAPKAAFLRVVSIQFPSQQIARLNPERLGDGLAETLVSGRAILRDAKQQGQFGLLVEFEAIFK